MKRKHTSIVETFFSGQVMLLALSTLALLSACPQEGAGLGEGCANSADCVVEAVCVQNHCRATCNFNRECGLDESCTEGYCFPEGLVDAGPDQDAALADVANSDVVSSDVSSADHVQTSDSGQASDAGHDDVTGQDSQLADDAAIDAGDWDAGESDAGEPPPCLNNLGASTVGQAIENQNDAFEIVWNVTPEASAVDAVLALSSGLPTHEQWSALATTVMFSRDDVIQGYNGDSYEADLNMPYSPGETYRVRMLVDVPAHQYSFYVTAPGESEQLVAQNFAFRASAEPVSSLDHMVIMSGVGPMQACLVSLQPVILPVEVSISPARVSLGFADTQQFAATVIHATDSAVTWSIEEADCGSISTAGLYTAPSEEKTCHVRATSVEDGNASAQAIISVATSEAPLDPVPTGTRYYFAEDGDDNNGDGTKAAPYRTLDKMNSLIPGLNPGDAVLFAMGDTFAYETGSASELMNVDGDESTPIIFSRYWKTGDESNTKLPVLTGKFEKNDYTWTETSSGSGIWVSNTAPGSKTRMLKNGVEQVQCEDMGEFNDNPEVELFHDQGNNRLVHRSATNPTGSVWTYAVQKNIFAFKFSEYIVFNGLEINWCYKWGTPLECSDSHHITVQNCKIGEFSHNAVALNGNYSMGRGEGFIVQYNTFDTGFRRDYSFDYIKSSDGVLLHNLLILGVYADHSLVQHNRFIDFGHCAIYLANTSDTVGGRWIHNFFSAPHSAYARPFDSTGSVHSGLEIAYNVVEHCSTQTQIKGTETHYHHNIFRDWGLNNQYFINDDLLDSKCSPISSVGANSTIENNIFYNIASTPIKIYGHSATTIRNNIFYNSGFGLNDAGNHGSYDSRGIAIAFVPYSNPGSDSITAINCTVENNLFFDDAAGPDFACLITGRRSGDLGTGDIQHTFTADTLDTANYPNWPRSNNLEGNPVFIDLIDFRIPASSPANDSGAAPLATEDYDGVAITSPYNIGLYNSEE